MYKDVSTKLNRYMNSLGSRGYFNGAVLVAKDGRILLSQGYGMANFEHDVPNTPITKFRLGAITKGFTAVAILQLQEQGKLMVDDFICQYLPDYPNGNIISIHHLLSNSSGIPDYPRFQGYWERTMRLYSPLEETIQSIGEKPLEYTPGERQSYCSSNYIILSAIIERVTSMSYTEYIAENICRPLGMMNTGVEDGRTVIKNVASGYSVCKDIVHTEYVDMSMHVGAGGMYSTVEDLYLWDRALYTDVLVNKDSLVSIFERYTSRCGSYGWVVSEQTINQRKRKRAGHIGSMNGFWADINRYVDEDLVIIVLSNINLTAVETISEKLARIAFGDDVQLPQPVEAIHIDHNEMREYAGIYEYGKGYDQASSEEFQDRMKEALDQLSKLEVSEIAVGCFHQLFQQYGILTDRTIIITYEDGKLYLFMPKQYHGAWFKYEIVPVSKQTDSTIWIAKSIDERLVFMVECDGAVRFIHYDVNGNETVARKIS